MMGMPITVEIADPRAEEETFDAVFDYFRRIDEQFSTYKPASEITAINEGRLEKDGWSEAMRIIFALSEETRAETGGYFDIRRHDGTCDPSGLVKGWAIKNAAQIVLARGFENFYVDAGGDIQPHGTNAEGGAWRVGIRNPFCREEIVKIVRVRDEGVATSGTYVRGRHIYNPKENREADADIVSLTVIGPNIYEADRFATAAFAMGKNGISFIEEKPGFEGYAIDKNGIATMTHGFATYTYAYA